VPGSIDGKRRLDASDPASEVAHQGTEIHPVSTVDVGCAIHAGDEQPDDNDVAIDRRAPKGGRNRDLFIVKQVSEPE
jgi:hypothetical protein